MLSVIGRRSGGIRYLARLAPSPAAGESPSSSRQQCGQGTTAQCCTAAVPFGASSKPRAAAAESGLLYGKQDGGCGATFTVGG